MTEINLRDKSVSESESNIVNGKSCHLPSRTGANDVVEIVTWQRKLLRILCHVCAVPRLFSFELADAQHDPSQ